MSEAKKEAIAVACAELNNVDLPNVYWLVRTLKNTADALRACHVNGAVPGLHEYEAAERVIARIAPYLPAGI